MLDNPLNPFGASSGSTRQQNGLPQGSLLKRRRALVEDSPRNFACLHTLERLRLAATGPESGHTRTRNVHCEQRVRPEWKTEHIKHRC
jgi:hypothetical protein